MTTETFNKIFKVEYLNDFKKWLPEATSDELKGLNLMERIYNTKGRVRLSEAHQQDYRRNHSHGKNFDLHDAERNYRMKQITTSYQSTFGIAKHQKPKATILKYKTLSELALSQLLTDAARSFIDNWLTLGNDVLDEQLILKTLRVIQARLVIKEPNSTEMKTSYIWKTDWSLSNPIRMDKAGSTLFDFKPNFKGIERQRIKQQKLRRRVQQLEDSDIMQKLTIYKQFKIN